LKAEGMKVGEEMRELLQEILLSVGN